MWVVRLDFCSSTLVWEIVFVDEFVDPSMSLHCFIMLEPSWIFYWPPFLHARFIYFLGARNETAENIEPQGPEGKDSEDLLDLLLKCLKYVISGEWLKKRWKSDKFFQAPSSPSMNRKIFSILFERPSVKVSRNRKTFSNKFLIRTEKFECVVRTVGSNVVNYYFCICIQTIFLFRLSSFHPFRQFVHPSTCISSIHAWSLLVEFTAIFSHSLNFVFKRNVVVNTVLKIFFISK